MTVISVQVIKGILRNKEVFEEFNQTKKLILLILLYPISPLVLLIGGFNLHVAVTYILGSLCFVPALVLAKKQALAFQLAGTDRVKDAKEVISKVNIGAFIGLGVIVISVVFDLAEYGLNS
tara:strand:+ start:82 stop:444 length:363 start_codon:yes stop_codon:yes gene_type:complete